MYVLTPADIFHMQQDQPYIMSRNASWQMFQVAIQPLVMFISRWVKLRKDSVNNKCGISTFL